MPVLLNFMKVQFFYLSAIAPSAAKSFHFSNLGPVYIYPPFPVCLVNRTKQVHHPLRSSVSKSIIADLR